MKIKVKPCPFCGNTRVEPRDLIPNTGHNVGINYLEDEDGGMVYCEGCGATINHCTLAKAIDRWNRRVIGVTESE